MRGSAKGVKRGDQDRNGDGNRELLIQPASDSGDEDSRNEYRRKDESDGDHRPGHFLHSLEGGRLWTHPFFDVTLYRFNDDNGIIDD